MIFVIPFVIAAIAVIVTAFSRKSEKPAGFNSVRNTSLALFGGIVILMGIKLAITESQAPGDYGSLLFGGLLVIAIMVFGCLVYGFTISELIWIKRNKELCKRKCKIKVIVCVAILTFPIWFSFLFNTFKPCCKGDKSYGKCAGNHGGFMFGGFCDTCEHRIHGGVCGERCPKYAERAERGDVRWHN